MAEETKVATPAWATVVRGLRFYTRWVDHNLQTCDCVACEAHQAADAIEALAHERDEARRVAEELRDWIESPLWPSPQVPFGPLPWERGE